MKIRSLTSDEIAGFEGEREWLAEIIAPFGAEFLMKRKPQDIPTLQSLLEVPPFSEGDEESLQVIGAALGDVIAETLGLEWVVVDDEYGTDFAIKAPQKMIMAFPRTMIIKRVEQGEEINLTEIYHGVVEALSRQIAE